MRINCRTRVCSPCLLLSCEASLVCSGPGTVLEYVRLTLHCRVQLPGRWGSLQSLHKMDRDRSSILYVDLTRYGPRWVRCDGYTLGVLEPATSAMGGVGDVGVPWSW